jgi:catalase
MAAPKNAPPSPLVRDVLQAFDSLNGSQPGFRPAHAKGILLSGAFTPAKEGSALTRAPHLHRQSTPVTVRFSDFAGVPSVPDYDENASPRGFAVRFHLAEHVHTDIIGHSTDGFPARDAAGLAEFLRAIAASGPGAPKPTPIEVFLGAHPAALRFVQTPKPIPTSFAREAFFGLNAYKFTNESGVSRFGRYRIRGEGGGEYLDAAAAASKPANFLFDEIKDRLAKGAVKIHIFVQLAAPGDVTDDCTVQWPEDRPQVAFGTLELTSVMPDNDAEQRQIIFDPIPRVDGIDPSADPMLEERADIYVTSGRRRRAAVVK